MEKISKIESILSHLFYFFFTAQIFSPYIAGRTIYLEVLIALINPYFIQWCIKKKINKRHVTIFIGVLLPLYFFIYKSYNHISIRSYNIK